MKIGKLVTNVGSTLCTNIRSRERLSVIILTTLLADPVAGFTAASWNQGDPASGDATSATCAGSGHNSEPGNVCLFCG